MTRLVVAYDDSPERYTHLSKMCAKLGWILTCVEHPEALNQHLDQHDVLAVLLDHDLRDIEGETVNGLHVANSCLVHRRVPVIVTSANRAGSSRIAAALREAAVPCAVISCLDIATEERWLAQLAIWAAQ